jgi:hypothetical protein
MTKALLAYLKFGNRFYSVELTQVEDQYKYYGIVLKKKRKQLDIETSFETTTIETLKAHIPKGKPIALVINTTSVLTKQVKGKTHDALKLANMAFPNIRIEDFYYETLSQGENHFVSICRKSYVDELLNDFDSKHITVIAFTLGSLICSTVTGFIESKVLQTANRLISIDNSQITEILSGVGNSEETYEINGLNIKNTHVVGFAAALNLVLKDPQVQSSFTTTKTELNIAFKQKQFANQFLKVGLSCLFGALLINFLFFNHYYNEVNILRETGQILEASKLKIVGLSEKVQKTEKMVEDVLQSSTSKSSFYVDVIINNLPNSILLKELNFQPLQKKIKENKTIENYKNRILISGQSNESIEFSHWISQLETIVWIKSIEILNFEDISKSSSSFIIKLNMQDDTEN